MLGLQKQINKQSRYENSRAYDIISTLKNKNLKTLEVLSCIELMASNIDNNETQQEVLFKAKKIVLHEVEMEFKYEARDLIPTVVDDTN